MIKKTLMSLLAVAVFVTPVALGGNCSAPTLLATARIYADAYGDSMYGVRGVATGDFNGDGKTDFAIAAGDGLWIALRDESTRFVPYPAPQYVSTHSFSAERVRVADMDNDGKADIVFTSFYDNLVTTLLGNGDGTFREQTLTIASPFALSVADLNRDGKPDLAVYSANPPTLTILRGRGDGTYDTPLVTTLPEARSSFDVGDFDKDGKLDLVLAWNSSPQLEVRRGNGDGTFNAPTVMTLPNPASSVTVADLNGDGRPDIVAAVPNSYAMVVLRNSGGSSFAAPVSYLTSSSTDPDALHNPKPYVVTTGNFMRRGRADIAVATFYGIALIFPANGDGTFDVPTAVSLPNVSPTSIVTSDPEQDGVTDLAIGNINTPGGILLVRNLCGIAGVSAETKYPTLSAGQQVTVTAHVFTNQQEAATGTLALLDDGHTLATASVADGPILLTAALPTGDHSLTVRYDGDGTYDPRSSDPVVVHVVSATTATTATLTPNPIPYAIPAQLTVNVTSSTGDQPKGTYGLTIDGAPGAQQLTVGGSYQLRLPIGTHTVTVSYDGDATHPPSTAAPLTLVVKKATPTISVSINFFPAPGQPMKLLVSVRAEAGDMTGGVAVTENGVPRGSATFQGVSNGPSADVPLGVVPPGKHTVVASYTGDENFNPVSTTFTFTVAGTPPPPKRRAAPHS